MSRAATYHTLVMNIGIEFQINDIGLAFHRDGWGPTQKKNSIKLNQNIDNIHTKALSLYGTMAALT